MIKRGAIPVTKVEDIFERFPQEVAGLKRAQGKSVLVRIFEKRKQAKLKKKVNAIKEEPNINISIEDERFSGLNEREKAVISPLLKRIMHIDDLARETNMDIKELNSILPVLEMMGYIRKIEGNQYKVTI